MSFPDILLIGLATWRAANLVTSESGPANVFGLCRGLFIDPAKKDVDGTLSELLSCPYCVSIWIGAILLVFHALEPLCASVVILPLAVGGIAAALQQWTYDRPLDQSVPTGPPEEYLND